MERVSDMVKDLSENKDLIVNYISDNAKKAFEIWQGYF
jgi:hypothetical protein